MLRLYLCTKKSKHPTEATIEVTDDVTESDIMITEPELPVDPSNEAEANAERPPVDQSNMANVNAEREFRNTPAEMTHDDSENEVILGASLNTSIDLDDTLLWDEPKTKVVLVIRRGNCLVR